MITIKITKAGNKNNSATLNISLSTFMTASFYYALRIRFEELYDIKLY
jgi:hypothetical protein